jgi:hypothetical protein
VLRTPVAPFRTGRDLRESRSRSRWLGVGVSWA